MGKEAAPLLSASQFWSGFELQVSDTLLKSWAATSLTAV